MDKKKSSITKDSQSSLTKKLANTKIAAKIKEGGGEPHPTPTSSSSKTKFFRANRYEKDKYDVITEKEYFGIESETTSTSAPFECVPEKVYTEKAQLKRNFRKILDPLPTKHEWTDKCESSIEWDIVDKLEFLVCDTAASKHVDRLLFHLEDFIKFSNEGFMVDKLSGICMILDFLVENYQKEPDFRKPLVEILKNTTKPILLRGGGYSKLTLYNDLQFYIGYLGYLLVRLEDDDLFLLTSSAVIWQLSSPNSRRARAAPLENCLRAAAPVLYHSVTRMLCVASAIRFPNFMKIALLMAYDTAENCIEMVKENIIEYIFYRFNPFFPIGELPEYENNPADPQDVNINLGLSSQNMCMTLSTLLVLLKSTLAYLEKNPDQRRYLPIPDAYSQRCFIWVFRYECRARDHRHERMTLTSIASALVGCFGERLEEFSNLLMPDVMSLSVQTELPARPDWTSTVTFNASPTDAQFKKLLIYLSVECIKTFSHNRSMIENRLWLLGLIYIVDPALSALRTHWSSELYAEIKKTALQALVCVIPVTSPDLIKEYGLIRRMMWHIEWYSASPYELPILYWCLRVLKEAIFTRQMEARQTAVLDLFQTHGIIIIINLCYTLLDQRFPPVELSQAIIALALRLLTSAVEMNARVTCCVYPKLAWPGTVNDMTIKMLSSIIEALENHYIISDRWIISLLNFIWEAIIWNEQLRQKFIARNGIFKLLDIITMSRRSVQCLALAVISDATITGAAVAQLVSWRASFRANRTVVKRGSTIATLLAALFRSDCVDTGVKLDENGIIEDLEFPLISSEVRDALTNLGPPLINNTVETHNLVCLAAADLAGSRMSKTFAIFHMLTEDLRKKVELADEAYNLYKNVPIAPEDEALLVLCSHYLTIKLNEAWAETEVQTVKFVPRDEALLTEFLNLSSGWAKDIKRQQEDVLEKSGKKELEEENSLFNFLGRVRLNVALDALRDVRCFARSADRVHVISCLLQEAVDAHHRRSVAEAAGDGPVLKTHGPSLDQTITGQYIKVKSIGPQSAPATNAAVPYKLSEEIDYRKVPKNDEK